MMLHFQIVVLLLFFLLGYLQWTMFQTVLKYIFAWYMVDQIVLDLFPSALDMRSSLLWSNPVVLNLVGGTEHHKFHACIHRTLRTWICFSYSNSKLIYITTYILY